MAPPIEVHAPIRKNELWVVLEQAFIVRHIQFDERVEAVEWWDCERVFRDYFRVWLAKECGQQGSATPRGPHPGSATPRGPHPGSAHTELVHRSPRELAASDREGLEALVYRDREQGKSYIHAIYD
ncbi:MAG TPA: hypothetical protein VJU61_08530 [Polyangiaceae bacterium]|nr:hypothetical protein [Polyangiaceae bacterium]